MRRFVSMKLQKQWFFCVTTVAQVRARCHAKKNAGRFTPTFLFSARNSGGFSPPSSIAPF
jgi:hypothetical protein